MRVGTSFSPRHAVSLGLDARGAFQRISAMGFGVVRVSAYWDEIASDGYGGLDWLVAQAEAASQPLLLTAGMKAMRWPEFYMPARYFPAGSRGALPDSPALAEATLGFIDATIRRYRDRSSVIAWQVENEPLNRAGPQRHWIDLDFLRREIELVRSLDQRPLLVNAFGSFNWLLDHLSTPAGFSAGGILESDSVVRTALSLLRSEDVLGLDVYTAIGYRLGPFACTARARRDWPEQAGRWLEAAGEEGKQAWIVEAQAEPWPAAGRSPDSSDDFDPSAMRAIFAELAGVGFSTILLWGSEHWLWQEQKGDSDWLRAARDILSPAVR